ncbi:MAG: M1 family metallopeptidase [Chloroflexota bacterium]
MYANKKIFFLVSGFAFILLACQSLFGNNANNDNTGFLPPGVEVATISPSAPAATTTPKPTAVVYPNGSIGDPYSPELGNLGYDVTHYNIKIYLDPAQQFTLSATVDITATSTQAVLEQVLLDFIGFEIDKLTIDGKSAEYLRSGDKLVIDLPTPLAADQTFEISISYQGKTTRRQSIYVPFVPAIGFLSPDEQSIFIASEPDGARFWFPNNDHPRDKALFRMEITVPEGLTAISNGLLIEEFSAGDGETTFIWQHDFPMATFLATVVVGTYERIETRSPNGILLRDYVFPEMISRAEPGFSQTGEIIDWMGELFGAYPFEAYGHATVNESQFALETQTISVMAVTMLSERVVVHELAHQWFGNWVSIDSWGEIWRSEGFATYMETAWQYRKDPDGFEQESKNSITTIESNANLSPLNALPTPKFFSFESYNKGAAVVFALQNEIGEEAMYAGLKDYFVRFGGGTASDSDFLAVLEEASGKSLDAFFAKWLTE